MAALASQQLEQLNLQLQQSRQELMQEIRGELDNSGDRHRIDLLNREPGDSGDESLANALADFNVLRFDRHIRDLRDIEAAFQRIKAGEYGVCTDCGDDIVFERLRAYPTAKRCIVCQQRHEKQFAHEGHPKL